MLSKLPALLALALLVLTGCSPVQEILSVPTLAPTIALPTEDAPPHPQNIPEPTATPTLLPGEVVPLWVTNPADHSVLRIDPRTNQVAARISISGQPDRLAEDETSVWVLDQANETVTRIDKGSERVVRTIPLPDGEAADIAAGNGSAWVGMTGPLALENNAVQEEQELAAPGFLLRIDGGTNRAAETLPVTPVFQLALRGQALWVLSRTEIDTPVQVFDVRSGKGTVLPLYNGPQWLPADALAVGPDCFWLFSAAHSAVFRVGFDGQIQARLNLPPEQPQGYAQFALADQRLWLATPGGSLVLIDAATNHMIGSVDLGVPLSSLTVHASDVWAVSQQTGSVLRVDPAALQITAQVSTGSALAATVVPTPTSRVVIWKPCPDAAASRLHIGDTAYVTKDPPVPNRVRAEPNREGEILGMINPGASMDVIEGPTCADNWVWWKIKSADLEGWTAEGDQETYWLVPLIP